MSKICKRRVHGNGKMNLPWAFKKCPGLLHFPLLTETTLRINLKMFNGNNFPHESLLTTRQKTKVRNAYDNNISTDLKLSKAQISKIIQSGGFWGSLLSKLNGPLMKLAIPLAKNVLALLGITAAASATDAGIQKK